MSETYPRKNHCETLFAGHTPSSIGFECKGTEKFADMQEKSHIGVIFLGVRCKSTPQSHKLCRGPRLCKV